MTTRLNPRHPHPPCICTDCGTRIRKGDDGADPTYGCCVDCRRKRGGQRNREKVAVHGPRYFDRRSKDARGSAGSL